MMAEEGTRQSGAALREPVLQDGERIGNLEAPADSPPPRPPWEVDELPGALGPQQVAGEYMQSDPDWSPGCWCASYLKMHHKLIIKAKEINAESAQHRHERRAAAGQEEVTIADSMKLLREQVFSLCPLHFLITGMVLSFALTVMTFLVPYFQGRLVDACMEAMAKYKRGEEIDEMAILGPKLAIVGALMFGSYFCEVAVGILFAISGHTTVTRLRIKLFRNLTVQEVAFYDVHQSGELSSRLINDSAALSSLTQFTTQTLLGAIVKFTGSLVAMYGTHWWLALVATILTPVNAMLVRRTGRTVGHYGVLQNAAMAKANAAAVEVLGNIRTVQSNVGETQEAVYFMERLNYYLRVIKGTVYLETALRFTSYGLSKVRDIVVLAIAMHQVITGGLSIGQYTAFIQYIGLYEDGFNNMANIWISFKTTIAATGKFVQLLLRKPEISPDDRGMQPVVCTGRIEFKDVCFSYKAQPELQVLTRINLTANPGDTVALVGESGAGKSTIGRLLQRYYDPTGGRILLDGTDLSTLRLWWLRAQLGVVEQEPVLFDRPLMENLSYGSARGKTVAEVEAALDLARASKFVGELPNGLQTYPGEKAARMSGGQKQRIAIARAVLRNPKVLLLDEATSSLDSENEYLVQQAIDSIMQERQATTFVIAHRLSTVKSATKIIVIQKGSCLAQEGTGFAAGFKLRDSLVEQGTHNELMKRDGAYAKYMRHQVVEQPEKPANLMG